MFDVLSFESKKVITCIRFKGRFLYCNHLNGPKNDVLIVVVQIRSLLPFVLPLL